MTARIRHGNRAPHIQAMKWMLIVLGAWQIHAAQAEIYRCQDGDVAVFSDQPCQENAARYQPRRQISVIAPAEDLEETAQRNRAFLEQRRRQRDAARERSEAQDRPEKEEDRSPPGATETIYVPYMIDRPPRRRRSDRRKPEKPEAADERFSPLSGRLPGTRRRDKDDQ
ncbi:MAG: DUF4124 domain-containing protein [Wenzhouxiangella sp.]